MKRIIISLTCIILFFSLCVFTACTDCYNVPQDCCIISVPSGFELWTEEAVTFEKIEKNIEGIEVDKNKNYYAVTKNASLSIVNFEDFVVDNSNNGEGKVLVGFDVDGVILRYSPSKANNVVFQCNKNTDVQPIYSSYQNVGVVAFVGNNSSDIWDNIINIDRFFNEDGSPMDTENFYYLIGKENTDVGLWSWQTNFVVCNSVQTISSSTYTVKSVLTAESQSVIYCVLKRYDQTKYFVDGTVYSDKYPFSLAELNIDIANQTNLVMQFVL